MNTLQSNNHLHLFHSPKKIFQKYSILIKIHPINYTKPVYCARIKNEMENYLKYMALYENIIVLPKPTDFQRHLDFLFESISNKFKQC